MTDAAVDQAPIDACWNRIGSRGDSSCPELATHTRCLNCAVFARAAARLLDRPLAAADLDETAEALRTGAEAAAPQSGRDAASGGDAGMQSALVFRVSDEWLALPTATLRQIDEIRPIHSLPHRRNRVVLGLVNIRGALTVAASLGELLQIVRPAGGERAPRAGYARMLVAAHRGEPVALPVDEVEGVMRFAASAILPVPSTLAHAAASRSRGLVAWRGKSVGLLDPDRVFDSLAGSLR